MVATFIDQPASRSYVRLPGTGSDRRAGVSYCDLSRGSSLAARIHVPQPVAMPKCLTAKPDDSIIKHHTVAKPRYLTTKPTNLVSVPQPVDTAISYPVQPTASYLGPHSVKGTLISITNNKRPRIEDATVHVNESSKRICLERTNTNLPSTPSIGPEAVPVTMSPHANCSDYIPTTNEPGSAIQNSNTFSAMKNTDQETKKLKEENSKLKFENATLQKQLSLFKQLITNPQRLQSVLQTLNKRVC